MGVLTTLTVGFFSLVIFVADLTNSPDFRADTPASNADLKVTLSMLKKIEFYGSLAHPKRMNFGKVPKIHIADFCHYKHYFDREFREKIAL